MDHPDRHLRETTLQQELVWQGRLLTVQRDVVCLPDGHSAAREYIRHPGAAVIVAIDEDGSVVMERQYRHPIGEVIEELPAGKLDPSEPPLTCAQRELREETGFVAERWDDLGWFWPCVGYSDEVIHVFVATGLRREAHARDHEEFLDVFLMPWSELIARAEAGSIRDGKTLAALFWARRWWEEHKQSTGYRDSIVS